MREYEKQARGAPDFSFLSVGQYVGFVTGVHDTIGSSLCTPKVTIGQVLAIVAKYLNANPALWSQPAHRLVTRALREAFQCP